MRIGRLFGGISTGTSTEAVAVIRVIALPRRVISAEWP